MGVGRSPTGSIDPSVTGIRDDLAESLRRALREVGVEPPEVVRLERPARREHGDWSSNVALASAKAAGRPPRDLAQTLADALNADPPRHLVRAEIAGPGFVNFQLDPGWLHDVLRDVVTTGTEGYARHDVGRGIRVNCEFVSANPTGPLHAGGGRWAAYGDALANVLERCGFETHREYYLNDRGNQLDAFAASLEARKKGLPLPPDGYHGQYIIDWAAEMPDDADPKEWGYQRCQRDLHDVLARMGVEFDTWFSEREMDEQGGIAATLDELKDHGATYEADGAIWLRSTDYGDEKDRVLVKSNGDYTYVLPDVAYHRDKFERGFNLLIDVWGADHHGYVNRLKAGVIALGHDPAELEIVLGQFVTLMRGGEEVSMGKRSGELVELADVLDEVGPDATRLTFLLQSIDTRQSFDIEEVRAQSMENPVFYVQYAYARIASMSRVAAERGVERRPLDEADLSLLTHDRELDLLRTLEELPDVVLNACVERAPHKVATWVRKLAGDFHGFYHDCWVLGEGISPELTQARLWLVEASRIGLSIGLDLLGVHAPESM
jgi:arginyl-tRNA synthetase